ncbi:hypothetical protein GCM10025865_31940 [Paraoerskovia sediminicola]|uniref:Metallo-beta-lactamase domain-containing protein n=1 Tax=Paraoerskovia sediminicola TaxID=1138587 RepID=A0ABN6XGJ8_9CELL|nr:hypothetical protein GCM10025865_31940 [Paraoerskovia sediminicola]
MPWDGPRAIVIEHRAHAPGHVALALPAARVLLAGDMLSDREVPLLDLDAADPVGDYRDGLAALERGIRTWDVRVVVPGHGAPVRGRAGIDALIAADRSYLADLERAARDPSAEGAGSGSGSAQDPRLVDPWVAGEHRRQLAHLSRVAGRSTGQHDDRL